MVMNIFEHIVEQYPPEVKKKKYEYWMKLRNANADYRRQHQHDNIKEEQEGFQQWMRDQWGLEVGLESQGYTPYFQVLDERKYLLFELKYV